VVPLSSLVLGLLGADFLPHVFTSLYLVYTIPYKNQLIEAIKIIDQKKMTIYKEVQFEIEL